MTTVYFYFNFPTTATSTTKTAISSSTMPCSSDIEYDCIKKNMYSNWEIGGASCSFVERCLNGTRCCNTGCPIKGCDKTCKQVENTGISCKGFNQSTCGCSGNFGSHSVTSSCNFYCFSPPTDTYCYPGAVKVEYVDGRKDVSNDSQYTFKATYNITTITTPAQIKQLEDTLNEKSVLLKTDYKLSNTEQLNILKKKICTSSNLLTEPCKTYCEPSLSGSLPTSNCTDSWNTFCSYGDNIGSDECSTWCLVNSNGNSNCKNKYLSYCDNTANFSKTVCSDFYKTQYINNQISDPVSALLQAKCGNYADADGNVLSSYGDIAYPVNVCACFLPDNVYNTFYDTSTKNYPELRKFFTVNQCSYPDCANTMAIQPQKITCPDVAVTSCIVNNTIGGNVTNSNFNIVNSCITQVEETGTYTNNNTNVAQSLSPTGKQKVIAVIPPADPETSSSIEAEDTTISDAEKKTYVYIIGVLVVMIVVLIIGFISYIRDPYPEYDSFSEQLTYLFFNYLSPVLIVFMIVLIVIIIKKIS